MPIAALPPDTVRVISASQVLTDSASLVKELVDNALDARASAIFVEISSNALDVIQVRDNGYGIAPVDRNLVCKRYCTSKITSFEDISKIGGQSLGFRGEALASAAEMSGSLIVSTRVEGESTAASLKISRQGAIDVEERISHPVGTTVRIVDFLKTIPVRRQSALKTFAKTLSRIKTTLQAYAMARPSVRFSMKVLKAKSEKGNLVYAPKPEASTTDAATKIFGKRAAEQCQWRLWSSPNADHEASDQEIYELECLIPKSRCDLSSINNMGQYLSVDSRPVSCAQGVFKQIVSLFKSFLKSTSNPGGEKVVDPFLYLNLICPQGSYDANIEPAKDDVLFIDAHLVLELVEACFRDVYGQDKTAESAAPLSKKATTKPGGGFDLLLARKQSTPEPRPTQKDHERLETTVDGVHPPSGSPQLEDVSPITVQGTSSSEVDPGLDNPSQTLNASHAIASSTHASDKVWKPNMYTVSDDSDVDDNHEGPVDPQETHESRQEPYSQDEESELYSALVSNPWTIAKINAPLRQTPIRSANAQQLTPARQTGDVEYAMTQLSDAAGLSTRALPSPERTQKASSEAEMQSSSPEHFPYPLTARRQRADNLTVLPTSPYQLSGHRGALDTWVQSSQAGFHRSTPTNTASVLHPNPSTTASPEIGPRNEPLSTGSRIAAVPGREFISARTLPTSTPLSEIPSLPQGGSRKAGTQRRGAGISKPFVSPVNDPTKVWFETGSNHHNRGGRTRSPQKRSPQNQNPDQSLFLLSSDDIVSPPTAGAEPENNGLQHPDLTATLAYETRKAAAMQQQRKQQQALLSSVPATPSPKGNSPHTNRYNKAVAALNSTEDTPQERSSSVFEAGDPRAYLLRHQTPGDEQQRHDGSNTSPSRAAQQRSRGLRRKTAMLPLESISPGTTTLDLVLPLPSHSTDLNFLKRAVKRASGFEDYTATGEISSGFLQGSDIEVVSAWEERVLLLLLKDRYGQEESILQTKIELGSVLRNHLLAATQQ